MFENNTRVVKSYDFTRIRRLVSELLDDKVETVLEYAEGKSGPH